MIPARGSVSGIFIAIVSRMKYCSVGPTISAGYAPAATGRSMGCRPINPDARSYQTVRSATFGMNGSYIRSLCSHNTKSW